MLLLDAAVPPLDEDVSQLDVLLQVAEVPVLDKEVLQLEVLLLAAAQSSMTTTSAPAAIDPAEDSFHGNSAVALSVLPIVFFQATSDTAPYRTTSVAAFASSPLIPTFVMTLQETAGSANDESASVFSAVYIRAHK